MEKIKQKDTPLKYMKKFNGLKFKIKELKGGINKNE